jgi:hypothetical protein
MHDARFTWAYCQVVVIDSGSPFERSQTAMHMSSTPRLLISVSTDGQNFAPSDRRRRTTGVCPARR